jgi:enhancing lycopene biosynthesis protein 2
MLKIGVVLSGCGFRDGAEIQEAIFTLYHLDNLNVEIICMAPNINQTKVVNHLTGETLDETRNVLVESARISRGNIIDIKDAKISELDALIFPGGFGAAMNLSDFAFKGLDTTINTEVEYIIKEMNTLQKPLGFICISPVIGAKVLGSLNLKTKPKLTIGNDPSTAQMINDMNSIHENVSVDNILIDEENKIVSTPAYMYDSKPSEVFKGIEKLVNQVIEMAKSNK